METSIIVNNSNFTSNLGRSGGGLSVIGHFFIEVYNSVFTENQVSDEGGILYILHSNSLLISNCTFLRNIAAKHGGAAYLDSISSVSIDTSNFTGNDGRGAGGAVRLYNADDVLVIYCSFLSNSACMGGALSLVSIQFLNVTNSNFNLNTVLNIPYCEYDKLLYAYQEGGALHSTFAYHMKFSNCVFINNSAAIGGAISTNNSEYWEEYRYYNLTIVNSSFLNNIASQYGGALSVYWCSVKFINLILFGNSAKIEAGALRIIGDGKEGELFIQNCTLTNNTASIGGAMTLNISIPENIHHLSHLKFIYNRAKLKGGAIALHEYDNPVSVIRLTNSSFTNNEVTDEKGRGGALALEATHQVHMEFCTFTRNNASYGGALYINRTSCFSKQCTFSENVAHIGGAVSGISTYVDFTNLNINKNLASENGGGMALSNSSLKISGDLNFTSKVVTSATGKGGAIYIEDRINDRMTQSCPLFWMNKTRLIILRNSANMGNMIYGGMFNIHIMPCPLGFQMIDNRCQCDRRLNNIFSTADCNIDTNLITIKTTGWFSYNGKYLRVHKSCPLNYCSFIGKGSLLPVLILSVTIIMLEFSVVVVLQITA